MNNVLLNTVGLDGGVIIKKGGGGGGVTINNQEKSVDITENGTTEVVADAGFTGLSKVVVNTNVASSGGGSYPIIGDGKTYLYIKIAEKRGLSVPLVFSQSISNGVIIDWGDGSVPQTINGTGEQNPIHTYEKEGDYRISFEITSGCKVTYSKNPGNVFSSGFKQYSYGAMLQGAELSKDAISIDEGMFRSTNIGIITLPSGLTSIGSYAFAYSALKSVAIPDGVASIPVNAFRECKFLQSIVLPKDLISIGNYAFNTCQSLISVEFPSGLESIGTQAFGLCNIVIYDFRKASAVPSLLATNAFQNIASDCKIVVPDVLYDEWKGATNWSTYASQIVKASEFNA